MGVADHKFEYIREQPIERLEDLLKYFASLDVERVKVSIPRRGISRQVVGIEGGDIEAFNLLIDTYSYTKQEVSDALAYSRLHDEMLYLIDEEDFILAIYNADLSNEEYIDSVWRWKPLAEDVYHLNEMNFSKREIIEELSRRVDHSP